MAGRVLVSSLEGGISATERVIDVTSGGERDILLVPPPQHVMHGRPYCLLVTG